MEQSEATDQQQEKDEVVDTSNNKVEGASSLVMEATDSEDASAATEQVEPSPVRMAAPEVSKKSEAIPSYLALPETRDNTPSMDSTLDSEVVEDEIVSSNLPENITISTPQGGMEVSETDPNSNLSQSVEVDENTVNKDKNEETAETSTVQETAASDCIADKGDVSEKVTTGSEDLQTVVSPASNDASSASDKTLVIDEEEHSFSASPDDLEPQLNECTGTFEKRRRSSSRVDENVKPVSESTGIVLESTLKTSDIEVICGDTVSKPTLSTENAKSEENTDPKIKTRSSIEDSIERCIANYTCHSPESPHVDAQLKDVAKFAQNVGFKIITNKVNFSTLKKAVGAPPKLKSKSKKVLDKNAIRLLQSVSAESLLDKTMADKKTKAQNASKDTQSSSPAKNVNVPFTKNSGEPQKEKSAPRDRPISCLKVRDVESINATIPIRAPVIEVTPEDTQGKDIQMNSNEKGLNSQEFMNPASFNHEGTNDTMLDLESQTPHTLSAMFTSSGVVLRPIAPKWDPIASHDLHSVRLIKDLIQLPSVPVYIPEETVSYSKHFNGRLHMCHGCGDRFVLLKSLLEHQNRRSCVIKFQCVKCESAVLSFFNRCEFIRHLYNHNQTLTTTMMQFHILVETLPEQTPSVVFDMKICHECKLFLSVPLLEHMQGSDQKEKKADLALKCQWCSLMLPTKCAYQAHRRMHFLQSPHVCPECGDLCVDLNTFNTHINSVCYHTSKRSLFHCSSCKLEMFDARKLERHIRNKHIKDVFKCNFCFVACFNLKDLEKHRQQHHSEKLAEEPDIDEENGVKYAFHLCDMCPNRLIRRVRLGQHLWDHTYSTNEVRYVYECRKCKVTHVSKDALAVHTETCASSAPGSTPLGASVTPNGTTDAALLGNPVFSATSSDQSITIADDCENTANSEGGNELVETAVGEEVAHSPESELMLVDEIEAPPPLTKAPAHQLVKIAAPPKNVNKTNKSAVKLISVKPDYMMFDLPKEALDFEDLPPETDPLASELEGGMEVALQCIDCGTNLTSELGSYCTCCEQKREAGAEGFPAVTIGSLLAPEKKGPAAEKKGPTSEKKGPPPGKKGPPSGKKGPPAQKQGAIAKKMGGIAMRPPFKGVTPFRPILPAIKVKSTTPENIDASKKPGSGNFTCRLCNVLISRTCDKAAIKRHFISKHKEIFIAALQTGMEPKKLVPKGNKIAALMSQSELPAGAKVTLADGERGHSVKTSFLKRPSVSSPGKAPPKKKKKHRKVLMTKWDDSDTEDEPLLSRFSSKDAKKTKDKKKKSYSPPPGLDQGVATSGEVVMEQVGDLRSCYKCPFQSANKEVFVAHVTTHKTNPKDLQCPACGTCFVVRPSLEKHLLIFHGMKNVDEYLADHGFPPVERDTRNLESEMVDVNQCKVCHLKFDSEALLEKHFRTHGSAFLLSNKFRRSS